MYIIRKFKLYILGYDTLTDKELIDILFLFDIFEYSKENYEKIDYIYNNFFNLEKIIHEDKSYFMNNKKIVMYDYLNNNYFIKMSIWNTLNIKYNINKSDIIMIIRKIMNFKYKIEFSNYYQLYDYNDNILLKKEEEINKIII